jgi:hypothetical protein
MLISSYGNNVPDAFCYTLAIGCSIPLVEVWVSFILISPVEVVIQAVGILASLQLLPKLIEVCIPAMKAREVIMSDKPHMVNDEGVGIFIELVYISSSENQSYISLQKLHIVRLPLTLLLHSSSPFVDFWA